jgi:hypothetical protein
MTTTNATPAALTFTRKDYYHQGNKMVIEAFDGAGKFVGWIDAIYHFNSSRLDCLIVRIYATGETREIKASVWGARKAVTVAKAVLEDRWEKTVKA